MNTAKADPPNSKKTTARWYESSRRRLLVDMHIPDWDNRFLSKLNPEGFMKAVAASKADSLMLYCNSHVGLTNYPSTLGPVHKAFRKKDFVGDVLEQAHRRKLKVVAYYSAVFNNAAFLEHPEWRIIPRQGESLYETSRYGACCPNSPYKEFAVGQTEEICLRYPFEGIFFDMLFWPYVCYCPHCQERFQREEGHSLPTTIDWHDPLWMSFQRARERWMSELAGELTAAVRRTRPTMTVTHQMSPVLLDWRLGMPYSITEHCDYASGDFYGPPIQQSVVCKIFEALSANRPFEFMTSRCVNLRDHVTTKTATRMEAQACLSPAHAGAFMFIDAIDPIGTLQLPVYERIGRIFEKLEPYEKFLGGELKAEVAIFVSSESRFDFRENGVDVGASTNRSDNMATEFAGAHMAAVMGAAQALQEAHIPYAIVTGHKLNQLKRYRVLVLPNVLVMSDAEVQAVRQFVAMGGSLYASGYSSLVADTGVRRADFGLADVYGISALGEMDHGVTFFSPRDRKLTNWIEPQSHLIHRAGWIAIENKTATILADLVLPWYPEPEATVLKPSFASIHSTPPGLKPNGAGIAWHRFGRGRVCYVAGPIEAEKSPSSRSVVTGLIRRLMGKSSFVELEAPSFVEVTVFEKPDVCRINLSLVSLRQEESPVPYSGMVRLRTGKKRRVRALRLLPKKKAVSFRRIENGIEFSFSDFEIYSLYEIEYQNQ